MAGSNVTAMIFTLDEAVNLPHCLEALRFCDDVIVVDSGSKDDTVAIAERWGARVFTHEFRGFGEQRNWAMENTSPKHEWVLILDADERVTPELERELLARAKDAPSEVGAYRLKRRFTMWGRWLRHSSLYPSWVVRFIRMGRVRYINRGHAETQIVDGETRSLEHDLIDENHKGLDDWFHRQVRYAQKEAIHELEEEAKRPGAIGAVSLDPLVRRAALKGIGARLPARPLFFFAYSYLVKGGFRDGAEGLAFCRMKATYQAMIEAQKFELRRQRRATSVAAASPPSQAASRQR